MNISRKRAVTMSLITSMLLAIVFIGLNVNLTPVSALTTTVEIDPLSIVVSPCDNFTVNVNVENVMDLYAWEFNITFDPNLVTCISVTEGPFLKSGGATIFVSNIDNVAGWVKAACSIMIGSGVSGSGTLAYIEFHCEGPGTSPLHFKPKPETDLYDSTGLPIPHVTIDGSVIQTEIEEPIHLHGPPLTPIHIHSNKSLVPVHMHSQQGLIDPTLPYATYWHELYPEYCQEWILNSWEDNGDGRLSPCDQIDMINIDTEEMRWYHLDRMTYTLDVSSEPPECWYTPPYKPPFPDYAPAGMPDFDEKQWGTYNWTYKGRWSHCGPVAVSESVWWLDSEFEWLYNPASPPPPVISDSFPLVQSYAPGMWDDHHPNNVQPLVEHLAWLMDCDGLRTGLDHEGTYVWDMEAGLAQYLSWTGVNPLGDVNGDGVVDSVDNQTVWNALGSKPGDPTWNLVADIYPETVTGPGTADNNVTLTDCALVAKHWGETGLFYEHTVARPDFYYIEEEVERCQDVVLLLGFWQLVEMMDQYQEICEQCEHVDTYWISWQEFVPTATSLSRVEVKIARTQGESNMFPITMTIESPLGNVLTSATLPYTAVPELPWCQAAWVSFDVPDIALTPGQSYYIVLDSQPLAYHWCGANGNPYTPGESNFGADWDWTFRTFYQEWIREWGHYVTVAGVDSPNQIIYLSDPCKDAFESGLTPLGRVPIPHLHTPPEPPYVTHNNASYVSHDGYNVTWEPCPGGDWSIVGYPGAEGLNVQIEYAVITSPRPQKMAIELKEPDVYDPLILTEPDCTLWHEVWPDYSNVYHIIDWIDSDWSGNLTYCDWILFEGSEIWWHVDNVATDLILNEKIMDPVCTIWHELYPNYSNYHHVTSWEESLEDPYPGRLSPCDQIDMENLTDPEQPTKWYHVDRVTLTLNMSNIDYPEEFMFIEFKGPFEDLYWVKTHPVCTLWHEVWPVYSEIYHITNWTDNCNGVLDFCDEISFDGGMTWWHVEDLAIDVILSEKMTNPVCTDWHALYPPEEYCNWYHIDAWEDNDDGLLSPCDQIKMTLQPDGPTEEYHVENVTLTLKVDSKYIELEIGDAPVEDALVCMANPLYTLWHEVYPEFCGRYELTGWEDNCNGVLDICDYVELTPVGALEGTWYHVEEVSWDMVVKKKVVPPPPPPPEDLELYPREVVILGNATCTQWHELHPNKTNYYHLTSWEPGKVLSPHDQIDMYAIDYPPTKIYLYTDFVDPLMPICSEWFEEFPTPQWWHLSSWEDNNGDGYLSECDQIDMTNMDTGEVVWFHVQFIDPPTPEPGPRMMHLDVKYFFQVDEVTIDLVIWDESDTLHWLDYECGYWTFDPKNPICTKWNEIKPDSGRCWHLTAWYDFNMNDYIDMGDEIIMTPMHPFSGPSQYCIVGNVTISLMLTPNPLPPVVPPPPVGPMYLESEMSYDEFDLENPVCTTWHEILPEQGRRWHLSSWEDVYALSPSDQIVLTLKDEFHDPIPGTEAEYHVDKLTVAMNLTSMYTEMEHIVKFEGSLKQFMMYRWSEPWGTQWHEVNPTYCRQWYLADWGDDGDYILDYCDYILMIDKETGDPEEFHVESLSTDIIVTLKVHDINVTDVTPIKTVVGQGYCDKINVTVANEGHFTETFNVTAYANITAIGTLPVNNLPPSDQTTLTFVWNTTGFAKGNYTIKAKADIVPSETDTADNTHTDGTVLVTIPGDVNGDRKVNMKDIYSCLILHFGCDKGEPCYVPNYDLNCDGKINMKDIYTAILRFGESW
jgi:general secretion pathway protein D